MSNPDMEKLKQLKELYDNGLLDEDEYKARKTQIIDNMTKRPSQAPQKSPRETAAPAANNGPPPPRPVSPRAKEGAARATAAPVAADPRSTAKPESRATTAKHEAKTSMSSKPAPVVQHQPQQPEVKERAPDECWECGERLHGKVASTNGHHYHMNCFKCSVCKCSLVGVTFFPLDDEVVCQQHAEGEAEFTCPKCQKPIMGDFVEAEDVKYHAECFVCAYGGCGLDSGWSRGADGEPYCFLHINMMAGSQCVECNKMITKDMITGPDGQKRHARCFVCAFCQNPIGKGKFYSFDNQAFCFECHKNLHYADRV